MQAILIVLALISQTSEEYRPYSSGRSAIERRRDMMADRRSAEARRRTMARMSIESRSYTDEERAESWTRMALSFEYRWQMDQSAHCRQMLIKLYPDTASAKLAQEWLWEHGF